MDANFAAAEKILSSTIITPHSESVAYYVHAIIQVLECSVMIQICWKKPPLTLEVTACLNQRGWLLLLLKDVLGPPNYFRLC